MSIQNITWPGHQTNQSNGATKEKLNPAVILPNKAEPLRAFGDEIYVHLGGAETGGKYTVFTDLTPPGGGPPPHYHNNEDEWFFPLEGRVEFFLNGEWNEVPMQTVVFIPRGTIHTFRNCGESTLKMLTHTSPAGMEIFF